MQITNKLPDQYESWQDFLCYIREKFPDLNHQTLSSYRMRRLYVYKGMLESAAFIYVEDVLLNAATEMLQRV
jgi:hypothetical protein